MSSGTKSQPSASDLAFNREMDFEYGVINEMAPNIRRIVAQNPSPFTFKGTNTYIVGEGEVGVIDPGPEDESHVDLILRLLGKERISHIIVTHTHRDHTGAVNMLKARTDAPVFGYGQTGAPRGAKTTSPSGKIFVDEQFRPDVGICHGDDIKGAGWTLDALHTPGHAPDHLCYALSGHRTLFSGDHVMGWNTTVVAPPEGSMRDYMSSLELLRERNDIVYFPGHGGRIQTPQRVVRAYLMHRKMREATIYACLENGARFIPQIVEKIYPQVDSIYHPAAALSVLAHLELLLERGAVRAEGPAAIETEFFALPR